MSMNIFEYLGLPKNHRTGQKVTQHVKHVDEVPESKKSWPMLGQIKKDGVYALVVKTKYETRIFSRTGKKYTNVEMLERVPAKYPYMDVAVYIAELCCDKCSLEVLSGIVNPNRKKDLSEEQAALLPFMYLAYHDAIPLVAFERGVCTIPYRERYSWLRRHLPAEFHLIETHLLANEEHAAQFAEDAIAEGEEGVVYKQYCDEMSDWKAGHKGYRQMKKVRGVDYDLLCIGAEEGKGKYKGLVANLFFQWKNGKTIKCMLGKDWTHAMAKEMWESPHLVSPVGQVFQVYALQESSKGKLRLPKVGEARHDKSEPDIKWEDE